MLKKETAQPLPILIYDGECHFCRRCVYWVEARTPLALTSTPYQDYPNIHPKIPISDLKKRVHFIDSDGELRVGAEAVFKLLNSIPAYQLPWTLYRFLPGFKQLSHFMYSLIANYRSFFSRLSKVLEKTPAQYVTTQSLLIRGTCLIYFIAFLGLLPQINGLIGANGILPVSQTLQRLTTLYGSSGKFIHPSLFWIHSSDVLLSTVIYSCIVISLIGLLGILPRLCLALLLLGYLSFFTLTQPFMSFQWDVLLLEMGALVLLLAPGARLLSKLTSPVSITYLWLIRLLGFKLVFFSGLYKLLSSDLSWRHLSALSAHFETQPLPHLLSWYLHQLPDPVLKGVTVLVLAIEILVPLGLFLGRRTRHLSAIALILFQFMIILSGHYGFFNLLSALIYLSWFDDQALQKVLDKLKLSHFSFLNTTSSLPLKPYSIPKQLSIPIIAFLLIFSTVDIEWTRLRASLLKPPSSKSISPLTLYLQQYGLVNSYALFTNMTLYRDELVIEGSLDGQAWHPFLFKYKPGALDKTLGFLMPYHPRLDWQLWFVALNNKQVDYWFVSFLICLLQHQADVTGLLDQTPFETIPPKHIKVSRYRYEMTSLSTYKQTGLRWKRQYLNDYIPPLSLPKDRYDSN